MQEELDDLGSEVDTDTSRTKDESEAIIRTPEEARVFISHGKDMEIVEQVETMLGLADIPYEIAVSEETSAIPVPEKVFNSMRKCNAAIIVVSVEAGNGNTEEYDINQNVLIEIGAAFVLYNRKVILLWDKRIPVPSNLQGLYRSEFERSELSWKSGMKLMKAIKDFRKTQS
jgi:predicted nucleotide-binding protein